MSTIDRQRVAAVRTLEALGYSYKGGEQWKPPLGRDRSDDLMNCVEAVHTLQRALKTAGLSQGAVAIVLMSDELRQLEARFKLSPTWLMGTSPAHQSFTTIGGVDFVNAKHLPPSAFRGSV